MDWSSRQYLKFEAERNRPIGDLLTQLPTSGVRTIIDLGCGPGNSTEFLQARYPDAVVSGIDSSPDMIKAARERLPAAQFAVEDIAAWSGHEQPRFDLVFANAALQWLPDHERLLPALMQRVEPGGMLAVQMPDNLEEPAHRLMRQVAGEGPWASKLTGAVAARVERHPAERYYAWLRGCAESVDIWRTTYHHVLAGGPGAIVEWFKGTGLRPYLDPLDEAEREDFLGRYEQAIAQAYPAMADGSVLLPFPRLFFIARR